MLRGVVRAALSVSLMLALWTLSRPAAAMPAGFCDDRGATAIASPPSLEAPEEAIERTRAPAPCLGDGLEARTAIAPGHSGVPTLGSDAGDMLTNGRSLVATPPAVSAVTFLARTDDPPFGVRARVERPPRG